jgi:N6-adenosine-specific RNA methylase IME4
MGLEEIKSLPIPAAPDSVLFLWSPGPKLEEALEVIRAWDFSYRTNLVWDKEQIGCGYWFRQQHEHPLVGVRGDFPRPLPALRRPSVLRAKRGRHSEKPAEVHKVLEEMYPTLDETQRIELFARRRRPGWSA